MLSMFILIGLLFHPGVIVALLGGPMCVPLALCFALELGQWCYVTAFAMYHWRKQTL